MKGSNLLFSFLFLIACCTISICTIAQSTQNNTFQLVADTASVFGNNNSVESDCNSCAGRFHVIAQNMYGQNASWHILSAPDCYSICTGTWYVDSYNCSSNCTFHIHNACPGTYIIAAIDIENPDTTDIIKDTVSITVKSLNNGTLTYTINDLQCNADQSGQIQTQTTLSTPKTYLWSNGNSTGNISALSAGTYTLTITDSMNCVLTEEFLVAEPPALIVNSVVTNATVPGPNNGSIDLTLSGGTPAYSFNWSNGATTEDIYQLSAGTYVVSVTDANNCLNTRMFRLDADSVQTTGLSDMILDDAINVYPNPFTDKILIDLSSLASDDISISITNVLGKTVYLSSVNSSEALVHHIQLNQLNEGIYFLKIISQNQRASIKLIKQF